MLRKLPLSQTVLSFLVAGTLASGIASAAFPKVRLEPVSEGEIVATALDLIEPLTGFIPAGMVQLMKWRYANGAGTVSQPYFETVADGVNVRVCGDAFLAGEADGTEASLLSCRSALESLA